MPPTLDPDPVLMERQLAAAIRDLLATLPHIGPIHTRERFPDDDVAAAQLTTMPDPVLGADNPITNYVEIGLPSVSEGPYTSDLNTFLTFTYPITYTLGVSDSWAKPGFEFASSGEMFIGMYMRARKLFKEHRTLGYDNCEHQFLQQDNVSLAPTPDGASVEHVADWSLTINVAGLAR